GGFGLRVQVDNNTKETWDINDVREITKGEFNFFYEFQNKYGIVSRKVLDGVSKVKDLSIFLDDDFRDSYGLSRVQLVTSDKGLILIDYYAEVVIGDMAIFHGKFVGTVTSKHFTD